MIAPRTLVSVFRTAFYGAVAGIFSITDAQAVTLVNAILVGGFTADFITWLLRSLFLLPNHLLLGAYDAAVYLLVGVYLFRFSNLETGTSGEAIAVTFLTFMLVAGLKVAYYGAEFAVGSRVDDN